MPDKEKKDFFHAVLSLRDHEECEKFFHYILSDAEFRQIPNRWEILLLLRQGVPQKKIAEKLRVGIQTVSRASALSREWGDELEKIIVRIDSDAKLSTS